MKILLAPFQLIYAIAILLLHCLTQLLQWIFRGLFIKEIAYYKNENDYLRKKSWKTEDENSLLKKNRIVCDTLGAEINFLLSKGYSFLGFQHDKMERLVSYVYLNKSEEKHFEFKKEIRNWTSEPFCVEAYLSERKKWIFNLEARFQMLDGIKKIELLTIDSENRGIGLGTIGMTFLDEIAVKKGIQKIYGEVEYYEALTDRNRLENFYKKCGYTIFYNEKNIPKSFMKIFELPSE